MRIDRRSFLAAVAGSALAAPALAQAPRLEKPSLTLGVGGAPLLYYLPLAITDRRGFFREQGLTVEVNDFGGGARSLQALVGGSVDVVAGAYEHTIRMQARGQDIRAVCELGRFPGIVLAVRRELADRVRRPGDLKGMKVGVTAPGSSTNFFVNFLLAKDGVNPQDVSFIGVGGGASAVAAMMRGEIDAISNLEPVISRLEQDNSIVVLADSRSEEGSRALFGGSNPAAVVYLKQDFIQQNPNTTQAITNAFYKSLIWLAQATPAQVAESVPPEYFLGDRALYLRAVEKSLPMYSRTGVIEEGAMRTARDMLVPFDADLRGATIDLAKTFDGRFVERARQTVRL